MKVLTFVIPAYNSETFVPVCVESMLAKHVLDKLEIIIVNDGSRDGTKEIAEQYCREYPKTVRLIDQENRGHGGALNAGCAAAAGKYLKVIDADDTVDTANLPAFADFLEACQSDVVLTHYRTVDVSTGEVQNWRCYAEEFGKAYDFAAVMANFGNFDRALTFHGVTYRTDFYRAQGIKLSEHIFYEDHEFATFPCCRAQTVTPVDLFIYNYRVGDVSQSVSDENQLRRIGQIERVLDRMTAEYNAMDDLDAHQRTYVEMKIQALLLRYLTVALLVHPDKAAGRRLAAGRMEACRQQALNVYTRAAGKYQIFKAMNYLHISQSAWDAILHSKLYRLIRGNHTFD